MEGSLEESATTKDELNPEKADRLNIRIESEKTVQRTMEEII